MKLKFFISTFFIILLSALPVAEAFDPPHNSLSGVSCTSCHGQSLTLIDLQGKRVDHPLWKTGISSDEAYNAICLRCHVETSGGYGGSCAPLVKTHAPKGTVIKCTQCHHNHYQEQLDIGNYNQDNFFIVKGTGSAINVSGGETVIEVTSIRATRPSSDWASDLNKLAEKTELERGALLVPSVSYTASRWPMFMIKSITITPDDGDDDTGTVDGTITVKGDASAVSDFGIFFGQQLRGIMETTPGNYTYMELYDKTGSYAYVRENSPYNGICQVCHEDGVVNYWTNNGTGRDHNPDENCMRCHPHTGGFLHGGGVGGEGCIECHGHDVGYEYDTDKFSQGKGTVQSHSTHTEDDADDVHGPEVDCAVCHDTANFPLFKDGKNLTNTDVCNNCHSPGGSYDGVNDPTIGVKENWSEGIYEPDGSFKAGKELWCISCHDEVPADSAQDGSGVDAPNKAGDDTTYGYYKTGHGVSGSYNATLHGQNGPGYDCLVCHDKSVSHISGTLGDATRLQSISDDGKDYTSGISEVCIDCHEPGRSGSTGELGYDATAEASIHSGAVLDNYNTEAKAPGVFPSYGNDADYSANPGYQCEDCHEVHGTTKLAMVLETIDGNVDGASNPVAISGFEASDTDLTDLDPSSAENDGVCDACHASGNDPHPDTNHAGNHNQGRDGNSCVGCHSHTASFAHGAGPGGTACVECHGHDTGSEYDPDMAYPYSPAVGTSSIGAGTFQSHSTHTETDSDDAKGPGIYCNTCHDLDNMPRFKNLDGSGNHTLEETDICNNCHSLYGTYPGENGLENSVLGAKASWSGGIYEIDGDGLSTSVLKTNKEKWCATCHDEGAANSRVDGYGVNAPNVIGDEDGDYIYGSGWGFYKTGHGLAADENFPSKGGLETLAGRPIECDSCHDYSTAHIDDDARTFSCGDGCDPTEYRQSYRLNLVGGQEPMEIPWPFSTTYEGNNISDRYRLCVTCHDSGPFVDHSPQNMNTNMRKTITPALPDLPYDYNYHEHHLYERNNNYPADYNYGSGNNSQMTCVTCHNVHGSTRLAMIRDGKLIDREPGLEMWYTKSGLSQTSTIRDPEPENIPLSQSDGKFWWGPTAGNLCSHCHGGSRSGSRDPYQDAPIAPMLDWTGETGFIDDGAYPNSAVTGSLFTFRVKYTDYNDEAPDPIQLWIDLDDDGTIDDVLPMDEADPSDTYYFDGKLYTLTLQVNTSGGDDVIEYFFHASDDGGTSEATGVDHVVKSITLDSATNNPPELAWVSGTCRDKGVSPYAEVSGSDFEFYVSYTDIDNNAPGTIQVWVDRNDDGDYEDTGEKHDLVVDAGDGDYINGENYKTDPNLTLTYAGDGKLNYRFVVYDSEGNLATGYPVADQIVTVINSSPVPIEVPGDYGTIQAALDAAGDDDTVLVYEGTYTETVSFNGSSDNNKYVISQCGPDHTIIDAENSRTNGVYHYWSTGSVIDGFQVINATGPGIQVTKNEDFTIEYCKIHDNAGSGVSGSWDTPGTSAFVIVGNSEIYNNSGSGLYLSKGGASSVTGTVIRNNGTTASYGGGIYLNNLGTLSVYNAIIADNQADNGGAIWVYGYLDVTNSTLVNNTATTNGGAFGSSGHVAVFDFRNSIIWGNKSDSGTGGHLAYLDGLSNVSISDSIVSNNGGAVFDSYPYIKWRDNNRGPLTFSGFISGNDPLFVDPANGDYHIQLISPALDNAKPEDAPYDDIDGDARPQLSGFDIGADEVPGDIGGNNLPILKWTGETNFADDGVDPDSDACRSDFEFRVNYTDADDESPDSIQVWIDLNDDGIYDSGEKFSMAEVDGGDTTYDDGKLYTYTATQLLEYGFDGSINYTFFASDGTGNAFGSPTNDSTVNITAPSVTLTSTDQVIDESGAVATISLQLSEASLCDIVVPFGFLGNAIGGGTDYSTAANPVNIAAGETTGSMTITSVPDDLDEDDETIGVSMGTPTNASRGASTENTITINDDDDLPSVSFASDAQLTADETGVMNITIELSAVSGRGVTVPFTVNASSTAEGSGTDYTIAGSPIIIPAGNTSAPITVSIVTDSLDEYNETIVIDMGSPTNATQGGIITHTVTITDDNDPPAVSFTGASQATADETGTATITVELDAASAKDVTIPFTVNASSTAEGSGTDYSISPDSPMELSITAGNLSAEITVTITPDGLVEDPSEVIIVDLTDSPTNATLGAPAQHTLTITDDDTGVGPIYTICKATHADDPCDYQTINDAIDDPTVVNGDTILISNDTYGENINFDGKDIIIKSASGPASTTLTGSTSGSNPVVIFSGGETSAAVLEGFTIDNSGRADLYNSNGIYIAGSSAPTLRNNYITGNSMRGKGAGVLIDGGAATIENCTIDSNSSTFQEGAGLYLKDGSATTTITDSSISSNTSKLQGGGLYVVNSTIELDNVTVDGNIANESTGGGAYFTGDVNATISNGSSISSNASKYSGSGIYFDGGGAGSLSISDSTIDNNSNWNGGSYGGGLYLANIGSITTLTNTSISSNWTKNGGGAIYADSAPVSLSNCTIDNNTGSETSGGGIWLFNSSASSISNGTSVTNNTTKYSGGGLYLDGTDANISDATISGNTSTTGNGGGLAINGGTVSAGSSGYIDSNTCQGSGGGIYVSGASAIVTVEKFFIRGNRSGSTNGNTSWGGGACLENGSGTTTITNCMITGNITGTNAGESGGGIANKGGTLNMNHSTVSGNWAAGNGRGIHTSAGTTNIDSSLLWDNTAPDTATSGGTTTINYSAIENGSGYSGSNNITSITGTVFDTLDAASSGNPKTGGNYHLEPDAVEAIDSANPASTVIVDIFGGSRPVDGPGAGGAVNDMGADEYGAP